jgi:hypothetical protein
MHKGLQISLILSYPYFSLLLIRCSGLCYKYSDIIITSVTRGSFSSFSQAYIITKRLTNYQLTCFLTLNRTYLFLSSHHDTFSAATVTMNGDSNWEWYESK